MARATYSLDEYALPLPITQAAYNTAFQLARTMPTPEKAEQVRLNTLSVLLVNDYLLLMDVPTNLQASDSWNPVVRLLGNVADLELPGLGRLECRPVNTSSQDCFIPPETWSERIGYVAVQIDESQQEGKILGFVPNVSSERLPLNQLRPLEDLIDRLAQLQQSNAIAPGVNLSQWLVGIFEAGWQALEDFWNQPELRPAYAFRSGEAIAQNNDRAEPLITRRAKLIDLGIQIANQPVILLVEISPQDEQQTSIRLQLQPTGNKVYLPEGLQLAVLDESSTVFLEATARSADNYIQLRFGGEIGERFSIRVSLDGASITENFVI